MLIDDILYALKLFPDGTDLYTDLYKALTMAVRFQVDNVAQYLHDDLDKNKKPTPFLIQNRIPNVAPLAPMMWFEYRGLTVGDHHAEQYGCFVSIDFGRNEGYQASKYNAFKFPEEVNWILRAQSFIKVAKGITSSDWLYYISVGAEGQVMSHITSENRPGPHTPKDFKPDENMRKVWKEEILISLLAICFAHCKGTVIEENKPSRQVRRAAERRGEPVLTFYTLDIQPTTRILRTEGHIAENGLAKALHICRGHFAHYTTEKPLFGKYTGTFYRPMHLRGKVEQGVTVKDYRVHPTDIDV